MTGRLGVVVFAIAAWLCSMPVSADEVVDSCLEPGVRAEMVWAGRTGPAYAIPIRDGQRLPYGEQKLVLRLSSELHGGDRAGRVLFVHEGQGAERRIDNGSARPDGSLYFEVPFDLTGHAGDRDVEITLGRRGDGRGERIDVLSLTLRPGSEQVSVVSVDRYPQLAWEGCPEPCYRHPQPLYDISTDDWRNSFRVIEIADGTRRTVEGFDVRMSHERPASIVFVVDTSGSVLQESSGDPSRRILDYFSTFPDAAYGGDQVRHSDRLAMLFFNNDAVGYYGGRGTGGDVISPARRFYSPAGMTASWSGLCKATERGAPGLRFDDAWLVGSHDTLQRAGYPLPSAERMRAAMCGDGGSPTALLSLYRNQVRSCRTDDECVVQSPGTFVLPALERAAADLDALHGEDDLPRGTDDNHRVVVLISDGIDASLMNADVYQARAHYKDMLATLRGKRFYFVDVHSELVLSKLVTHALARSAPLYRAALAGIEDEIDDPELSLKLSRALFDSDDVALRSEVWAAIQERGLERVAPDAPALRRMMRNNLEGGLRLPLAVREAVTATYPDIAAMILGGRDKPRAAGWEEAIPENWLRTLCNMFTYFSPGMMRNTVSPEMLHREVDALRARTVDRFHALAAERSGLSITLDECRLETPEGETLTGAVCAFRTILDSLRDTLHLRYVPGDTEAHKVKIDLTLDGRRLLEEKGMRKARLFRTQ